MKRILSVISSIKKDTLVMTGSTDKDGNLAFDCLVPHGRYYVRELVAPHGWKLNQKRFPVEITPSAAKNGMIAVSLAETVHDELIYGRITLTKKDISGKESVPGALIEVYDASGDVYWRAYTDRNGQISDIPVTPGKYTFREIIAPEGFVMDGGKCILQLRGVRPFLSDKYDITKHPYYKYLADADKKNTFDIKKYLQGGYDVPENAAANTYEVTEKESDGHERNE